MFQLFAWVVLILLGELNKVLGDMFDAPSRKRSDEMEAFINTCRDLGLPLNASKQPIHGLRASVLGEEIDGFNGRVMHSRDKGIKLMLKTFSSFGQASRTHVQHWCGLFCFASGFRRPFFPVLQEVFPFMQNFPEPFGSRFGKGENGLYQSMPTSVTPNSPTKSSRFWDLGATTLKSSA